MTVLVTGANGLLGQKLVALLQQDENIQLIATAHRDLVIPLTRGTFYYLDITSKNQVNSILEKTKPDVIVNTAAMTNVDRCELEKDACIAANVTAVQYLAEACEKHNIHLIHISTDFIFDGTHGPLDETELPGPVNFYGQSKLDSERVIQSSNISWCIIRTVLVYGVSPGANRSNIVLWVKKNLEEGKPIQVVNDQWRTPTLVEDLALGCYLAIKKKVNGVFHISGKDFLSPYDIANQTADYFNLDKSLITPTDSSHFKQPAARPLKTGFIIDKAMQVLGYHPHSFKEGLAIMNAQLGQV